VANAHPAPPTRAQTFWCAKPGGRQRPWLPPVIPAIRRQRSGGIEVQSQPGEIVLETLSRKNPSQKRAQGVGPEFKSQNCKKNPVFTLGVVVNTCNPSTWR
jgi:hypothetical protein